MFRYVTFLSPNKKVTKEISIGEALMSRSRAPDTPSPMYPSRSAIAMLPNKARHWKTALPPKRRGINKGGAFARSAPLFRLLLVLFLPKQEKNIWLIVK